ncbi:MAG: SdpI family protein [Candidatus Shapirobacteria bacterium]|nr:SdpI family protein [Candidatus Shapirobacteria bacterium]MDD3002421.1 SdpI family protein [Candidatus Shapirobacteria bacterium]MDD4383436.1 SdpI family protein [Candidatus Shapirobacteria bacterium]
MKINKISVAFPIILIIISFFIAIYFYPVFPDQVTTHWGIDNQANGYSSKAFGLFFMPVLSVFLFFLFISLPKIEPYKKNFDQFKNHFQNFINIVFAFLFYVYLLTIIWNLDFHFNMIQFLSPGFAVLFYYAGVLTSHAKRNWFVGIRTPWTMSSELVWDKTHQLGGKLFKLTGLISLLSLLFPNLAIFFILVSVLFVTVFIFVYSYLEYKKIN